MFNFEQAFALRDEENEGGVDFRDFYFLMMCIQHVKKYGQTSYGSLTEDEAKKMFTEAEMFSLLNKYIENSSVMKGDPNLNKSYNLQSEVNLLSHGAMSPYRMIRKYLKSRSRLRAMKKRRTKAKRTKDDDSGTVSKPLELE